MWWDGSCRSEGQCNQNIQHIYVKFSNNLLLIEYKLYFMGVNSIENIVLLNFLYVNISITNICKGMILI